MKALLVSSLLLLSSSPAWERRCGWLDNPTPGNWYLTDRDGGWDIGWQGGFQAQGIDRINLANETEYVRTNRNYGYGCACMDVTTKRSGNSWRITTIKSFQQLPLKQCLEDYNLPKR